MLPAVDTRTSSVDHISAASQRHAHKAALGGSAPLQARNQEQRLLLAIDNDLRDANHTAFERMSLSPTTKGRRRFCRLKTQETIG